MMASNPVLTDKAFSRYRARTNQIMTLQGTINKGFILLGCVFFPALWVWNKVMLTGYYSSGGTINFAIWGGLLGGLIMGFVTIFKKEWSPVTAPIYCLFQGLALGGLSALMETVYPGIVMQGIGLTFGVFFMVMAIYKSRIIEVNNKFIVGVVAATGAVMLVYLASFILGFFGMGIPLIHGSGPIGIGFSVVVVCLAAMHLMIDFDFIEKSVNKFNPKFMEWYAAFGVMVTLIWLYLEVLRLLGKTRD